MTLTFIVIQIYIHSNYFFLLLFLHVFDFDVGFPFFIYFRKQVLLGFFFMKYQQVHRFLFGFDYIIQFVFFLTHSTLFHFIWYSTENKNCSIVHRTEFAWTWRVRTMNAKLNSVILRRCGYAHCEFCRFFVKTGCIRYILAETKYLNLTIQKA